MKKILIVDDDPTVQKLVSSILAAEGYDVAIAKDGIDAMVALKKEKPDLLVLDIMMPEFNGYDVCHAIKFDPVLKDLPIVILTQREKELDSRLGVLMGIEYLHKPVSPKELVAMISGMLARKK
ncbi:MAG: response regulator [Candidatus Omnitrophica bacterium]|nr:response regulator [Candidatus Omnitrophota bacterium]